MKIEPQSESTYVNASFVLDRKISEVTIVDDVRVERSKFDSSKSQHIVTVDYKGAKAEDPNVLKLVARSINLLIKKHGDETKEWIGKTIPVKIGGEGQYQYVVVDEVRL